LITDGANRPTVLVQSVLDKIREQVQLLDNLADLVPADRLDWRPPGVSAFSVDALLGHVLDGLTGFCAVLAALNPQQLGHFQALRELEVNRCGGPEARQKLRVVLATIELGFASMTDDVLATRLPTALVPAGQSVLALLLGNLEHLINHKFQLFFYLKLLGVDVSTNDLYCLPGRKEDQTGSPECVPAATAGRNRSSNGS
jgi:hypothetical protein